MEVEPRLNSIMISSTVSHHESFHFTILLFPGSEVRFWSLFHNDEQEPQRNIENIESKPSYYEHKSGKSWNKVENAKYTQSDSS